MVLNRDSAFKSWHWPPKCKACCRRNDGFTYHFTCFATIRRLRLQIVAKYVISYVKSSLCLQRALHLGGQCHDLKKLQRFNTISGVPAVEASILRLTLHGCKKLSFLLIFLYNAKPSFEIAKWMAKDMLWQNMKINKILQKTWKLKAYITRILAPKGGRPRSGRPPFGSNIGLM